MVLTRIRSQRKTRLQNLDKLRVLVGQEIIRNLLNTRDERIHILRSSAGKELFDQYSLKILLNWIATQLRMPACTHAIHSAKQPDLECLQSWSIIGNEYPFYTYFAPEIEENTANAAFKYLSSTFEPDLQLVGDLYMQTMKSDLDIAVNYAINIEPAPDGRQRGEFYTPLWLADLCIRDTLSKDLLSLMTSINENSGESQTPYRFLDPACGTGNFLLAALRFASTLDSNLAPTTRLAFAKNSLHGCDLDMRAVCLARHTLILALSGVFNELQLLGDDWLLRNEIEQVAQSFKEHIVCADALTEWVGHSHKSSFDLVVTNPPYISYGARNQQPMKTTLDRYLRARFPAAAEYKIRLHSLFQELAVRLCKHGGNIVLLVPDAFLNGAYYARLRKYLVDTCHIVSLAELPESTFDDAVAGRWCIAGYRKRLPAQLPEPVAAELYPPSQKRKRSPISTFPLSPEQAGEIVSLKRFQDDLAFKAVSASKDEQFQPEKQCFDLPLHQLISPDKLRFQLVYNSQDANLLDKLRAFPAVSTRYRGYTGIRSRSGQAAIVAPTAQPDGNWKKGLISGANVTPFRIVWGGQWLDITPEKLFAGGFDGRIIGNMKLLVRQTADRPIGAVDENGLYHLNNIHSFAPIPITENGTMIDDSQKNQSSAGAVWFLSALLNSNLWLYLYQLKSRENKRALAQIDIEMVESLPLPRSPSAERQLSPLCDALVKLAQRLHAGDISETYRILLRKAIDRAVYEVYELSTCEIDHIEHSVHLSGSSNQTNYSPGTLPTIFDVLQLVELNTEQTV